MTNILEIDFSKIPNPEIKDVLLSLDKAFREFGIDFYLIGARARDLWFSANEIPPHRFTRDIDFAILVPDIAKFKELTGYLSETGEFNLMEDVPHRMIFIKNRMLIDLMPFGEIEKSGYTHFNDRFDTRISVLGMQEVFEKSVEAHLSDIVKLRLATLPGLCILKLIAWNDKPEIRQHDIEDIYSIILNFFDIESDKIYEKHLDLFDDDNFEIQNAGARVMGRQIADIIDQSDKLKERIISILEDNTSNHENSNMGMIIAEKYDTEVNTAVELLRSMLTGIKEKY